jgi:signal transduction histidine kinase
MQQKRRYFPLPVAVVVTLLGLFVAAIANIAWTSYASGKAGADELKMQLADQVGDRVREQLDYFFSQVEAVLAQNQDAITWGRLDYADYVTLGQHFIAQVRHFPYMTFIAMDFSNGDYIAGSRSPHDGKIQLWHSLLKDKHVYTSLEVDEAGKPSRVIKRGDTMDARTRNCYQQGLALGVPAWYPAYKYDIYDSLGIGISAPIFKAKSKEIVGVVTGDVALVQISHYLHTLGGIGQHGLVFVAEENGDLIASSTPAPTFFTNDGKMRRIAAWQSKDALVREAGKALNGMGTKFHIPERGVNASFTGQGATYFIKALPFARASGLRLAIVVVMAEQEIFGLVDEDLRRIAMLSAAILVLDALAAGQFFIALATERSQTKAELQAALHAERRMRLEQRQFVAMLTHELRNPLAVIDSAAMNVIVSAGPVDERLQRYQRQIHHGVRRIVHLIDNCLVEDRLYNADLQLHSELISPRQIAADAAEIVAWSARHQLVSDVDGAPATLRADPSLLRIALSNLLDNAVKYSRPGKVCLSVAQQGGAVVFKVSDSGPGIPKAQQEMIFERYCQGDKRRGGVGLGLFVVRTIAELHGGKLWLAPTPEGGCCFCLQLPAAAQSA